LEKIENIDDLRQLVLEKERDLHLAARLGLAVAKKNQHIENRLRAYSHFELETQRKVIMNGYYLLNKPITNCKIINHQLEETAKMNVTAQERWSQEQRERSEELHERFEMIARVNAEVRREIELFREEFQAFRKDVTHINTRVDELSSDLQETNRRLASASKRIGKHIYK
jgi:methyl-accepting chemotaxis protein